MLTVQGSSHQFCDGLSRRTVLKIGGLAMGGLSLPQLLAAEAGAKQPQRQKSVIMIFLSGGPPHQDMVDLKMDAPAEIRGEFRPIATKVPGIQICEHLPGLAATIDKWTIIRSLVGSEGRHAAFQCNTGWPVTQQPAGGWPSFGSIVSKLKGPANPGTPPFVSLSPKMKNRPWGDPGQSGFVGQAYSPFTPNADGGGTLSVGSVSVEQMADRRALAQQLDRFKRAADANGAIEGLDAYQQQAFSILTSGRLAEALDLEKEDPKLRDRYGRGSHENAGYGDAGPLMNDYFLVARRLVESGVRVVSLAYGRWDWHGRPHGTTFDNARDHLPLLDQGLTALIEDLTARGMIDDVSIVVWGEFGRTPRINKNGGRDHWPNVGCAMLAGGGMKTGQVIGATDRLGDHATERPVHFQDVFATLYNRLGIDINRATVNDLSGRPRYLVDHTTYQPLREVV
ncbi:DUF1501 domain-containing protein [Anatilimnocola sp. NA78]|uniref:DUF1501 domain-containing protein n=1 Tax=Anatilimnocola sp. NA78 TaxID=3415683 RepID=UPI003CE54FFA